MSAGQDESSVRVAVRHLKQIDATLKAVKVY